MKWLFLSLLMMSQIETAAADGVVAPPSATMQFEEAKPAPKMKPANITPSNPAAPAGAVSNAAPANTLQPANVAPQRTLPAAGAQAAGPIVVPVVNVPNISSNDNPNQTANIIQQFMSLLNGQNGAPSPYLANGQPNPAYGEFIGGSGKYRGEYGPEVKNDYRRLYTMPITKLSKEDIAKLRGHDCSSADKDRLVCMVCNLMFEAANEPEEGQLFLVQSVMTRVYSGAYARKKTDNVCSIVYAKAQYSWTLENKDHRLPTDMNKINELVAVAEEGMRRGPNGFTNYWAIKAMKNQQKPYWADQGQCRSPQKVIANHTFCKINGTPTRTIEEVAAAEGLSVTDLQRGSGTTPSATR